MMFILMVTSFAELRFLLFASLLVLISTKGNAACLPCKTPYGDNPSPALSPSDLALYLMGQNLEPRAVYNPRITSPDADTKWIVGSSATVTWDASDMPPDATDKQGKIVLGYQEDCSDEHLFIEHPLADGFDFGQESVDITVPDVEPRDNYIIVLFGDSGNRSPMFTISKP